MPTRARHSLKKGTAINQFHVEAVVSRSHSGITYRVSYENGSAVRLLREYFPTDLARRSRDGEIIEPQPSDVARYEAGLTEFLRQTDALSKLRDPYIERIEGTLQANNTAYQVIEFDEGQTLEAMIKSAGIPLPSEQTEKIFREILCGLGTLHDAGLFHLDLSARNIYVRENGPCMLTGFGNTLADSGFPSAETAQGDLAALAMLTYKCATGSRQRPSLKNVAIRLENTALSEPIRHTLIELLDPEKCKQYQGANEVLRQLPGDARPRRESRLEIEQSVQNSASPAAVHARRPPPAPLENRSPDGVAASRRKGRQTRVLGGRITPVARKQRSGGKAGWWILGTVCVLVGLAILIPTPSDTPPGSESADGANTDSPERAAIYVESRVDEELSDSTTPSTDTTFLRQNDEDRANDYRMAELEEAKINELLAAAAEHMVDLEYTEPPGSNALEDYRAVLALNSANARAKEGIVIIMDRLVESGVRMLQRDEATRASTVVEKISQIEPGSPQQAELEQAVAAWHTQQEERREAERTVAIDNMLSLARDAINQGRIISPTQDNALQHYRDLLDFDPGNESAQQGITSIAEHYLGLANESILSDDLRGAEGYLTTAEVIQADNTAIALLREQINVKERQQAMGLTPATREAPPVAAEIIETPPVSPPQPTSPEQRPVETVSTAAPASDQPQVVDLSIAGNTGQSSVLSNDERQLQAGLDAYYQARYEEAYQYLTPLSYRGIARAQFRIGIMYQLGRGVVRDTERAEEIISRALPAIHRFAEGGLAWAQADLGSLYEDGLVVDQDYELAVRWYRAAANQGYAGAQTNLGVMYALGRGVERDRDEAIRWLQLAADQGDIVASENLKTLGIR